MIVRNNQSYRSESELPNTLYLLCFIKYKQFSTSSETMLMMRSLEQINTVEFMKEGDIHDQIEGIQNSIAQGMR